MDFSIETVEPLIDHITVTVHPDEYADTYKKTLKDTSKRISLPGFRPGMVPAGLVKKRFGVSLLAEQLNKLVSKGLTEYLQEQEIRFMGRPYLQGDPFATLDPEGDKQVNFVFEVGREPEFTLNMAALQPVYDYQVEVSDADVAEAARRYRYQFGQSTAAERVEADKPYNIAGIVTLTEPQTEEEARETRLPLPRLLYVHTELTPELRPLVAGKRVGESSTFRIADLAKDDLAGAALLRVDPDTYQQLKSRGLTYDIRQISLNEPAENGPALYAQVLQGQGTAPETEADFLAALKAKLQNDAKTMSEVHWNDVVRRDLLAAHPFELPDRLLIRWLVDEFEEFRKPGELEKKYGQYRADMRFHLIQRKLKEQFPELELGEDDMKTALRERYAAYFNFPEPAAEEAVADAEAAGDVPAVDSKQALLDMLINNVMQDENMYQREYNQLASRRFFDVLQKQVVTVQQAPINYQEFEQKVATGAR